MNPSNNTIKHCEYNEILISQLEGCKFTFYAAKLLNNMGIYTLNDLFYRTEKNDFMKELEIFRPTITLELKNEIIGTAKILRCKYLNEDPKIPFNEPYKIDINYAC